MRRRVKLYIKRVFITDENVDIIPKYLRFLRGIIDSEDLPLNISRETLQHNSTIEKIKASITKRVLSELSKKKDEDRETYQNFWNNFGAALKEGLCEAMSDHDKILEICLFKSALNDKNISLDEYIDNFKPGQNIIYYLSGENSEKLKNSPQIEGFISQGIDVLFFTDPVDDYWVHNVSKYKDFEIKSVTRSDIDTRKTEEKKEEEKNEDLDKVIVFFKDTLGEAVQDIKISRKLTSSPACLAVGEGAVDIRLERHLIEQKQLKKASAKILELNPTHPIILHIKNSLSKKLANEDNIKLVNLLFDQACISEGEPVRDPSIFCKQMNEFFERVF
jgi:molecular chaperone HtpG